MYQETGTSQAPVRIIQTAQRKFVGHLYDGVESECFGPFEDLNELMAVMADWLARAIRDARIEVERLSP